MTATFHIEYYAQPGERLVLVGHYPKERPTDSEPLAFACPMQELAPGHWQGRLTFPPSVPETGHYLSYRYELRREDGALVRQEWGSDRRCLLEEADHYDAWCVLPPDAPAFSQAFTPDLPEATPSVAQGAGEPSPRLTFAIQAPAYGAGYELRVVGSLPSLGAWSPQRALPMLYAGAGRYEASIPTAGLPAEVLASLSYKYVLWREDEGSCVWEEGADRSFRDFQVEAGRRLYLQDDFPRLPVPQLRRAGVAFPLFALRSDKDWGIGDFGTLLEEAIPFAEEHDLQALQLLPINDTTFTHSVKDSYPYNAISVDALHPIYIAIDALPRLRDEALEQSLRQRAKALREKPQVDFPAVLALKEEYLRALFAEQGAELAEDEGFQRFATEQAWLAPYACYCVLRDRHPGQAPQAWPEASRYSEEVLAQLMQTPADEERYRYHCWVQYLLDYQLRQVAKACGQRGLFLKGDLPIGVAPHGVEVWAYPELFHTEQSAGAPPDAFAAEGQNWGFPTYDWERMAEDDYAWWKARLLRQARYFSALRIDHVLGFFRIWEIPRAKRSGLEGHFHPALPYSLEEWQALLGDSIDVRTLAEPTGDAPAGIAPADGYPLLSDPYRAGYFHPRIAWEKTETFRSWGHDLCARWRAVAEDYFYVRHNALYRQTGLERLRTLAASTRLLLCAEDLGMIPASVPDVLSELQILSLELERMPKGYTPTGWADPLTFPQRSVATTSTHDMPSLRGWWQALPLAERKRYLREELGLSTPVTEAEVYGLILQRHLQSPAMLAILPLADWMSCDERLWLTPAEAEQINHPEDPNQYWCFRFPCSLPAIAQLAPGWGETIRTAIHHTHRTPFARLL